MSEAKSESSLKKLLDYLDRTGLLNRLDFSDEDLADSIWLALQMGVEGFHTPQEPEKKEEDSSSSIEIKDIEENTSPESKKSIDIITEETQIQETENPILNRGFPFQVPAAPALQRTLPISGALRPLMRKVPSATKTRLDEEATVTQIGRADV